MSKLSIPLRKPVARRRLVKFLRAHGWTHLRSNKGHDVWASPDGGFHMALPSNGHPTKLIGNPFLRQINAVMEGRCPHSRARRTDGTAPNPTVNG